MNGKRLRVGDGSEVPSYTEILELSFDRSAELGATVNGDPVTPTFAVHRDDTPGGGRGVDMTGRPGIGIAMLVDGAPPATRATVSAKIPTGTIVTIGTAAHRLDRPLDLAGGDLQLMQYFYQVGRFGTELVEPVWIDAPDERVTRMALRLFGSVDGGNAYIVAAANRSRSEEGQWQPFWFEDAFTRTERTGIPEDAANIASASAVTRTTIGENTKAFAPHVAGEVNQPIGWGDASIPPFPARNRISSTISNFATAGLVLDAGVGIATFDDVLTENWADGTAVRLITAERLQVWGRTLSDQVTERLVQDRQQATVQTVAEGEFEIAAPTEPAAELLTDAYGRVWTVTGIESAETGVWRIACRRVLQSGAVA